MKAFSFFIHFLALAIFILPLELKAQWPKEIKTKSGALITVYQPQPETLKGNKITGRTAFSAKEKTSDDPTFGMFWYDAIINTDRDSRMVSVESVTIKELKLPGITDTTKISKLKALLESEIPKWKFTQTIDELSATLEEENKATATDLKNEAPVIYFKDQPTLLVQIDGEPKLQDDKELSMKRVINTAFLIVQNPDDQKYYFYGGQQWYVSSTLKEGYKVISTLPTKIAAIDEQIKAQAKKDANAKPQSTTSIPPALLISTSPAELIQTKGTAEYANIAGTSLLYVSNSEDDIFKNINDQQFYVLLSGRWYTAPALDKAWTFIASDKLPEDFKKIPEGSEKDNVLASVAGTTASKDAIMDAQIPQTAKVDRKTATCTVKYDGDPKFEKIEGTSMELAVNTSSTVMKSGNKYYCVETGIWFVSDKAVGPWAVSDERPKDVDKIPASSSAYNTQYVYIYDSTPDVVYVGYTPGYMGCYVYGPTVVYGTGYYYNPWYGPYYYPRPVTYGFCMHYNPYMGWSMGFHYSTGVFVYSSYHHPGYWGPPMYRPPYYAPYHGGMYGHHGPTYVNNSVNINVNNSNNIYNKRTGATTKDIKRNPGDRSNQVNKPSTMDQKQNRQNSPANLDKKNTGQRPEVENRAANNSMRDKQANDVYAGKDGSVNQRNNNGGFDQRDGNQWKGSQQNNTNMNNAAQNRERSTQQNNNFNQNHSGNMNRGNMGGGGGRGRR